MEEERNNQEAKTNDFLAGMSEHLSPPPEEKKGKAPEFYSSGWKNREDKIPADPHSLFKIASISKLYIAAAAAKLVDRKKLSLDKTLADYLPELIGRVENADKITLRMMLQHRSGIPNFIDSNSKSYIKLKTLDGIAPK